MVGLGAAHGVRTTALLTQMDVPLGRTAGNALEVVESVEVLAGGGPADVVELTLGAGPRDARPGRARRRRPGRRPRRRPGHGRLAAMVRAQGGDPTGALPRAAEVEVVAGPGHRHAGPARRHGGRRGGLAARRRPRPQGGRRLPHRRRRVARHRRRPRRGGPAPPRAPPRRPRPASRPPWPPSTAPSRSPTAPSPHPPSSSAESADQRLCRPVAHHGAERDTDVGGQRFSTWIGVMASASGRSKPRTWA